MESKLRRNEEWALLDLSWAYKMLGQPEKAREYETRAFSIASERPEAEMGIYLATAAQRGDLEFLKAILNKGANVNSTDGRGWTPLQWAASHRQKEAVKLLKEHGATMTLPLAAMFGDTEEIQRLVESGADLNARDEQGATALMRAAGNASLDVVKLLLEKGAEVNATSKYGRTALLSAVGLGANRRPPTKEVPDLVRALVDKGADVKAKTQDGETVLMGAASLDEPDIVRNLLEKGLEVNAGDKRGKTALMRSGPRVAKLLLDNGADFSVKDKDGMTPLMFAAQRRSLDMVKLLLDKGADSTAKDNDGKTVLMFAAGYRGPGNADIVRALIAAGAEINGKDNNGRTALMKAVTNFRGVGEKGLDALEVTKALLEKGADVNAKDKNGETALMDVFYALWNVKFETGDVRRVGPTSIFDYRKGRIEYGSRALFADNRVKCKELAQLLLEHGADANAKDNEGRTALSRVLEPLIEVEGDNITQSAEKGTAFAVKVMNGTVRVKRDPPGRYRGTAKSAWSEGIGLSAPLGE
jgi:ankyrin repeat protein